MTLAQRPVTVNDPAAAAPRISIEMTNICNLHCSYCFRDDDNLYHTAARFFPAPLLGKIVRRAKENGIGYLSFTGGEVTIHPQFEEIIAAVATEGLKLTFVTNGWHFDRVYPLILKHREAHDRWRGAGSFNRVVRAITRCHASNIRFVRSRTSEGVRRLPSSKPAAARSIYTPVRHVSFVSSLSARLPGVPAPIPSTWQHARCL